MGMECLLPSQSVNKLKITSAVHIHNQKGLMYYVELHLWAFRDLIHMCHSVIVKSCKYVRYTPNHYQASICKNGTIHFPTLLLQNYSLYIWSIVGYFRTPKVQQIPYVQK